MLLRRSITLCSPAANSALAARVYSYTSTSRKRLFKILDGTFDLPKDDCTRVKEAADHNEHRYNEKYAQVLSGGGSSSIHRHQVVNKKLLPRERIKLLLDEDYPFLELAPFAGLGLEYGDICSAGGIAGIGKISGQLCMVQANDATVKGGTVFPIGVKKQLRIQEIAEENSLPCVYIVDSGGAFLPLQAEIFPETGGRVFYNEARMNALGIPQICVVAGSCTAGAAYIPTMANEVVMVDKIGTIFLAGPPLVHAAIGEIISDQDLGGATVHCQVSGCADYQAYDEMDAIETVKGIMSSLNLPVAMSDGAFVEEPHHSCDDLPVLAVARGTAGTLNIRAILARLLDGSRFQEFKPQYGRPIVTGFGHLYGTLVGVVANNGFPTCDALLKASHFVMLCNERGIPILFLQDIPEQARNRPNVLSGAELIKAQAQLISAVAVVDVPKITLLMGNSQGVWNYSFCGRSMSPRFLFTWPGAKIFGQMSDMTSPWSADSDAEQITTQALEEKLERESDAFFASARLWDDGIIPPRKTRHVLGHALTACVKHKTVRRSADLNVFRM